MAALRLREGQTERVTARRRRAAANTPRGQETGASGAFLRAAHGGLRENRVTMLRLPRAAHYSICDLLCARDAACLSETASQWYQRGDPRHAAFFAALADRVARARGVAALRQYDDCYSTYLVPDKTIPSMIKYLEAVERLGSTKIVEQTTYMRCGAGSDPLTVESHEDIDGQVVARASSGMPYYGITSVAVAGKHVTQIEPHQPYHYVSYGLVVHEKELPGGRTIYYVAWPGITDVHPHLIGWPGRSSCRIVTKRPSWEPKPAWTPTQQKAIEKQAKRLAITDEIAAVLYASTSRPSSRTRSTCS